MMADGAAMQEQHHPKVLFAEGRPPTRKTGSAPATHLPLQRLASLTGPEAAAAAGAAAKGVDGTQGCKGIGRVSVNIAAVGLVGPRVSFDEWRSCS
jgi:hypothetical protein